MTKDSKFSDDLKKAKNFYKKKFQNKINKVSDSIGKNYRGLDDETVKISKLSARIDILKDSLIKKNKIKPNKTKKKIVNATVKNKKYEKKSIPSIKNKDINGVPLINYISKSRCISQNNFVILKDFEINSKLFLSGNINKLPEDIIQMLLTKNFIKSIEKTSQSHIFDNSFYVKETFGLSEIKRSKLRNKKNLNEK
mgnify:FL=1